jgi:hypothetical protein
MTDWYYEENGAQRGPVPEGDLNMMLVNHLLPPNALVWTASFGSVWKPASQTQLNAAPQPVGPPALPQAAMPSPISPAPARAALPGIAAGILDDPVEVPAEHFRPERVAAHDHYAKWMAFWPLVLLIINLALIADGKNVEVGPYAAMTSFLAVWGSLIFAWLDARNVYRSWRNPKRRVLVPFVFLSPLGYFWRRAWVLKTSYAYLWIWLACALAYAVVVAAATMAPGA